MAPVKLSNTIYPHKLLRWPNVDNGPREHENPPTKGTGTGPIHHGVGSCSHAFCCNRYDIIDKKMDWGKYKKEAEQAEQAAEKAKKEAKMAKKDAERKSKKEVKKASKSETSTK